MSSKLTELIKKECEDGITPYKPKTAQKKKKVKKRMISPMKNNAIELNQSNYPKTAR